MMTGWWLNEEYVESLESTERTICPFVSRLKDEEVPLGWTRDPAVALRWIRGRDVVFGSNGEAES